MPTIISGDGTITGLTTTGISAAQTVTSVTSSALPAGTVLQVVNGITSTRVASATSTFIDTGVTATITPKFSTSKILVMITLQGLIKENNDTAVSLKLQKNGSDLSIYSTGLIGYNASSTRSAPGGNAYNYYDSPATTSALTYKVQICSAYNLSAVSVNDSNSSSSSTITLLEVAA